MWLLPCCGSVPVPLVGVASVRPAVNYKPILDRIWLYILTFS